MITIENLSDISQEIQEELDRLPRGDKEFTDKYIYARSVLLLPSYLADEYAWGEPLEDLKIPETQINADIIESIWKSGILGPKPTWGTGVVDPKPILVSKRKCDLLRPVVVSVINKYSKTESGLNLVSASAEKGFSKNYGPDLYNTLGRYYINCVDPYQPTVPIKSSIRDVGRKIAIEAKVLPMSGLIYGNLYNLDIPDDVYNYMLQSVALEAKNRWSEYEPDLKAINDPTVDQWISLTKKEFDNLKLREKKVVRISIDEVFQIVADNCIKNIPIIERYYYQFGPGKFGTWKFNIAGQLMTPLEYFRMVTIANIVIALQKATNMQINAAGRELILDMLNYVEDYWGLKNF